jgi:hypothetical protein
MYNKYVFDHDGLRKRRLRSPVRCLRRLCSTVRQATHRPAKSALLSAFIAKKILKYLGLRLGSHFTVTGNFNLNMI